MFCSAAPTYSATLQLSPHVHARPLESLKAGGCEVLFLTVERVERRGALFIFEASPFRVFFLDTWQREFSPLFALEALPHFSKQ